MQPRTWILLGGVLVASAVVASRFARPAPTSRRDQPPRARAGPPPPATPPEGPDLLALGQLEPAGSSGILADRALTSAEVQALEQGLQRQQADGLGRRQCLELGPAVCPELTAQWTGCLDGEAAACRALAARAAQPPRHGPTARFALAMACRHGDADACASSQRLNAWWSQASDRLGAIEDGAPTAAMEVDAACARGDVDACGIVHHWTAEGQPFDPEVAWRACRGGVARACRDLARAAPDPSTAVRALEVGCDHGSVPTCQALYSVLVGDGLCSRPPVPPDPADRLGRIPCPPPDRARAAAIAARIERLTGQPFAYQPVPPPEVEVELEP
ncbi:MAG: hypothetical protein KBG48_10065 [Kofleriaceae bacterium]|nr:hypothetical protein [Kofleriaceae bacterium]MBP9167723.1 hypothetical protein [Kofleriaceae bacterium]MBP9857780.1 hypothetical protein [Kofleriaceae bacterium]